MESMTLAASVTNRFRPATAAAAAAGNPLECVKSGIGGGGGGRKVAIITKAKKQKKSSLSLSGGFDV